MFTMIAYQISREHIGSLHRTGCKDIPKDASAHAGVISKLKAQTVKEALAEYLDAEMIEMAYSNADVKVLSCAKQATSSGELK